MPEKVVITFNGSSIMSECGAATITANPVSNTIETWVTKNNYLCLMKYQAPCWPENRTYVLFSPKLRTDVIRGAATVLKRNKISSGFDVDEALFYEKVYAVGPFEPADLVPLTSTDVTVDTGAPYDSATSLRLYLEKKLSS